MKTIQYMIVSDHEHTMVQLQKMLNQCQQDKMVFQGSAHTVRKARPLAGETMPDILFCHIGPVENVEHFSPLFSHRSFSSHTELIFISEGEEPECAHPGLENKSVTWLAAPVEQTHFVKIVHQLAEKIVRRKTAQSLNGRISLKGIRGLVVADPAHVACIRADGHLARLMMSRGQTEVILQSIGSLEELFPDGNFVRIDRSTMINLDWVDSVSVKKRTCLLRNGPQEYSMQLSRAGLTRLLDILKP
jgi:DNA-binding LytR/AlgR family response regulator